MIGKKQLCRFNIGYVVVFLVLQLVLLSGIIAYSAPPWPEGWGWETSVGISGQARQTHGRTSANIHDYFMTRYGAFPDFIFWEPDTIKNAVGISVTGFPQGLRYYESGMWPPDNYQWNGSSTHFRVIVYKNNDIM